MGEGHRHILPRGTVGTGVRPGVRYTSLRWILYGRAEDHGSADEEWTRGAVEHLEIERKFDVAETFALPDLAGVRPVWPRSGSRSSTSRGGRTTTPSTCGWPAAG